MHERAIADAVWDDTNAPICDSSDLRLLLLLTRGICYPRSRIARCHGSRSHAAWLPGGGGRVGSVWLENDRLSTRVIHKRSPRLLVVSPAFRDHELQKLADKVRSQCGERRK